MGRLSDEDWAEMSGRLRTRAARLIKQLDAGAGYREQIERDLEKRIQGDARRKPSQDARLKPSRQESDTDEDVRERDTDERSAGNSAERGDERRAKALAGHPCASCETVNDADAKFCKSCGARL